MDPAGALKFIVQTAFGVYMTIVLARFLLQVVRADFYNPVSQFILKATSPLLLPLRKIIPSIGTVDTASIVLLILLSLAEVTVLTLITYSGIPGFGHLIIPTITNLAGAVLQFYLIAVFLTVILSWIQGAQNSPIAYLLRQLTDPLLVPARRLIPPIGGLDISPMVVIFMLLLLQVFFGV